MLSDMNYSYVTMPNVLLRADVKDKNVVYLEASNPQQDTQKEIVLKSALEDQTESFLKKGVLSWDHQHKLKNSPEYIVGEPLDVKFADDDRTLVKGKIYHTNKYGEAILNMAKAGSTRLGASIGGYIVQRVTQFNPTLKKAVPTIARILWDEVAVTHRAVNEGTTASGGGRGVSVMPFTEFKKSWIMDASEREAVIKALVAGYGTEAATMTGGRALQKESLQGAKRRRRRRPERLRRAFVDLLGNLQRGTVRDYSDLVRVMRSYGVEDVADAAASLIVSNRDQLQTTMLKRR